MLPRYVLFLSGVLGLGAPPGSGKTLAFLLPLVIHAKQAALKGREGVKDLIVSPTRELAVQSAQVECQTRTASGGNISYHKPILSMRCDAHSNGAGAGEVGARPEPALLPAAGCQHLRRHRLLKGVALLSKPWLRSSVGPAYLAPCTNPSAAL